MCGMIAMYAKDAYKSCVVRKSLQYAQSALEIQDNRLHTAVFIYRKRVVKFLEFLPIMRQNNTLFSSNSLKEISCEYRKLKTKIQGKRPGKYGTPRVIST